MDIEKLKKRDKYILYAFPDKPTPFCELFKERNFEVVDVLIIYSEDDATYAGSFKWEFGKIISLDGDTYNENMKVYGYKIFSHDMDSLGLSIIVGTDW